MVATFKLQSAGAAWAADDRIECGKVRQQDTRNGVEDGDALAGDRVHRRYARPVLER
jgi:hypothetical protein